VTHALILQNNLIEFPHHVGPSPIPSLGLWSLLPDQDPGPRDLLHMPTIAPHLHEAEGYPGSKSGRGELVNPPRHCSCLPDPPLLPGAGRPTPGGDGGHVRLILGQYGATRPLRPGPLAHQLLHWTEICGELSGF